MSLFRKRSLLSDLLIGFGTAFLAIVAVVGLILAVTKLREARKSNLERAEQIEKLLALRVNSFLDRAIQVVGQHADAMATIRGSRMQSRKPFHTLQRACMDQYGWIYCVWACGEPGAIDTLDRWAQTAYGLNQDAHLSLGWYRRDGKVEPRMWGPAANGQMYMEFMDVDITFERPYYKALKAGQSVYVTGIYQEEVDGIPMSEISIVHAVRLGGEFLGAVGVDVLVDGMNQHVLRDINLPEAIISIISADGEVIISSDHTRIGARAIEDYKPMQNLSQEADRIHQYDLKRDGMDYICYAMPFAAAGCEKPWSVIIQTPKHVLYADLYAQMRIIALIVCLAIGIFALVAYRIARAVLRPIQSVNDRLLALSQGDLTQRPRIRTRSSDMASLDQGMETTRLAVSQAIKGVQDQAQRLGHSSGGLLLTAQTIKDASAQQAASTEQMSASIEQLSASINLSMAGAKSMEHLANTSLDALQQLERIVDELVGQVDQISHRIGVVKVIAARTNLLALNAAVEAAQAGVHGRGFAVVATEVRRLAEQAAASADEIVSAVQRGSKASERVKEQVQAIIPSMQQGKEIAESAATAAQDQAAGVGQINHAISELAQAATSNAQQGLDIAANAEMLTDVVSELRQRVAFFKLG